MKRFWLLLCSIALCLTCLVPGTAASAITFPDVDASTPLGQAVYKLVNAGVVNGKNNGLFDPNGTLTRAQFVKVANLLFGYKLTAPVSFSDVPATYWAYDQIRIASQAGYIQGYADGTFRPNGTLTREQFCVMLDRINNYENTLGVTVHITDTVDSYARQSVYDAIACGLFTLPASGAFRARSPITRGEMALALAQYASGNTTDGTTGGTTDGGTTSGGSTSGGTTSGGSTGGGTTSGGSTGGGASGGTTGGSTTQTPQSVLDAMQDTIAGLGTLHYTDTNMAAFVSTLSACAQSVYQAGSNTYIDQAYVKEHYATQISQLKQLYNAMGASQKTRLQDDLVAAVQTNTLRVLNDYFLA